jgi:hypothetical protein
MLQRQSAAMRRTILFGQKQENAYGGINSPPIQAILRHAKARALRQTEALPLLLSN